MNRGTHQDLEDHRNKNILIYINGEIVPRSEAKISVFDSGFLLGDGVWEGIRLHNGKMVFLEKHLNRIYKGAEELAITIGKTKDDLINLLNETIQANGMKDNVHIRLIVSRGLKKTPYQHPNANVGDSTIVIIPEYKIASKEVLKKGCPLNFNEFENNNCAGTVFHGINIVIDFVDKNPDTFNLLTLRSFGESFYHHITDAALEFGYVGV